jgi:hypothetical protein
LFINIPHSQVMVAPRLKLFPEGAKMEADTANAKGQRESIVTTTLENNTIK